jgi:hypothetical protein
MMISILVSAQYYENYSDSNKPYWKNTAGADFYFPVDSDLVMWIDKEDLKVALMKMVEAQSNEYSRYEYISHEFKFSDPIVVEGLGEELGKMSLV